MFRDSPDNRRAGVRYRCGDIDGQKTRDLPDVAGLLRPCDRRSVDEGGAGSSPGPRALRLPAKFHWLRAGFQTFATKLGDTSAAARGLP